MSLKPLFTWNAHPSEYRKIMSQLDFSVVTSSLFFAENWPTHLSSPSMLLWSSRVWSNWLGDRLRIHRSVDLEKKMPALDWFMGYENGTPFMSRSGVEKQLTRQGELLRRSAEECNVDVSENGPLIAHGYPIFQFQISTGWWFGCHFFIFPHIGNFIIPIDEVIFFRGVKKNHQPVNYWMVLGFKKSSHSRRFASRTQQTWR